MPKVFKNRRLSLIKSWRIWLLTVMIFGLSAFLIFQFFMLQFVKAGFYKSLALEQHQIVEKLTARRGEIYMIEKDPENRYKVAVNTRFYVVYVDTRKLEDKEETKNKLVEIIGADGQIVDEQFNKEDDPFEIIKKEVTEDQMKELEKLELPGIYWYPEDNRFYVEGYLASQVLGFLGYQDDKRVGQYGIEQYYNEQLQGKPGHITGEGDTSGIWIATTERKIKEAENGQDLILTLDRTVQLMVEEKIKQLVEEFESEQGTIIVMNPNDGAVVAMANYPTYDLNSYSDVEDAELFLNPAIHEAYEPGSIFKPITMTAALDSGAVLPDSTFYDPGVYTPDDFDRDIYNFDEKKYGRVTMSQILEKSINTGTIHLVNTMGKEVFTNYVNKFEFNEKTGIDLVGEAKGNTSSLEKTRGDVNFATASFGQGITVTPLGITRAISAIANGGELVRPHMIYSMIDSRDEEIKYTPSEQEKILKEETTQRLKTMMVNVVEKGHAQSVKIDGYHIAGKTGTAQVANKDKKGYSETETNQSFVGFFPAFEPRFTILVKLDKPKKSRFATQSAAPAFRDIAKFLINYYDIPPDY